MTIFVADSSVVSWGRLHRFEHQLARPLVREQLLALLDPATRGGRSMLPIGLGRSYGDSGLNEGGAVVRMAGLDRLIAFDRTTGLLDVECGISLGQVLDFAVPCGFFLPVVPGTSNVTVGGAIANDVHGKNHHSAGTFGRWVREIELLRTDGSVQVLGPDDTTGLFAASIGGMGLTGIIARARIQLKPIASSRIDTLSVPFASLSGYFAMTREHIDRYEQTVAWIDGSSPLGRGLFTVADHRGDGDLRATAPARLAVPLDLPAFALNRYSISLLNAVQRAHNRVRPRRTSASYQQSLFPLDALSDWNRIYGRRGMYQYQCVLSEDMAEMATAEMLRAIWKSACRPLLIVAKTFGDIASPGLMSFPKQGTTLALDFPNLGGPILALFETLDRIVRQADGRLYPAKDARMSAAMFRSGYPLLDRFAPHVDPGISSSFWRRVNV